MPEEQLSLLDKFQPFILIAAVFIGIFAGSIFPQFSQYSDSILYFVLILLVYSIMLGISVGKIASAYKNIRFFGLTWIANFIIIPIIAWILALIFLQNHPAIFVGFILYLVTPCTDWVLVFTSLAKGDVPLGLALLPTNLILQIILIPVYLFLFAGKLIPFEFSSLIETFLAFVLLPFILAALTRFILRKTKTPEWANKSIDRILSPFQLLTLTAVIFTMFAGQTKVILQNFGPLAIIFIPLIIFFILSFIIAQLFSRKFNLSYKECALFTCTAAARNSPLSLAIAFGLFPDQPLIQVAIIIGVLIELPILILVVRLLEVVRRKFYKQN